MYGTVFGKKVDDAVNSVILGTLWKFRRNDDGKTCNDTDDSYDDIR